MQLTAQQNIVFGQIKAFMESDASVFILRGYAGTGKTTMVKIIADYISQSRNVALMAPTGRAARVLHDKTGYPASTIHKEIYGKPYFVSNDVTDVADSTFKIIFKVDSSLEIKVAIVDEASMLSSKITEHELFKFGSGNLMEDLLTYIRPNDGGKVIFVGDPAQLPPVGENVSNALNADYFNERGLKVMEANLSEVLRQKGDSLILKNAMMIRSLLEKDKRNHLVFEEKEDEVESINTKHFLGRFLDYRQQSGQNDCVVISFSNKAANQYNKDIRNALYGENAPLNNNDILIVSQNNYMLNRMNGEFVPVLSIGSRVQQSAPVYVESNGKRERVIIKLNFVQVTIPDGDGNPTQCMLLEDFLTSDKASLSVDESKALYINFCMRHQDLKKDSKAFYDALMNDIYYNALRAKYGYAVTGHKCQGGEWGKVFVDYTDRTGLSDDCLRWAYTATTRASKSLYYTNLPKITPFSKFKIVPIQKCKNIDAECLSFGDVPATPFHSMDAIDALRAKYHCIAQNFDATPYRIHSVVSHPYLEIYNIETPDGIFRFDLYYKAGGIFQPAKATVANKHSDCIKQILDDEQNMPFNFCYSPSNESHGKLHNIIKSVCDTASVRITNIVEHSNSYNIMYYFRTSGTYSYLNIYVNANGFITYAKPMSLKGTDDGELAIIIELLKSNLI